MIAIEQQINAPKPRIDIRLGKMAQIKPKSGTRQSCNLSQRPDELAPSFGSGFCKQAASEVVDNQKKQSPGAKV